MTLTSAESARSDLVPDGEVVVGNVPLPERDRGLPGRVPRVRRGVFVGSRVLAVEAVGGARGPRRT